MSGARVEEQSLYPWMDTGCGHVCAGRHPGEGGLKRIIAWKGARPCADTEGLCFRCSPVFSNLRFLDLQPFLA